VTARRALAVLGLGIAGAQAGHLVAYELRFGVAAPALQSSGAHAYFPALAKTGFGLAAIGLLASLLVVAAARIVAGRRLVEGTSPSFVRLLAVLYTIQLACFAGQETAEALLGGTHASSALLLILWGTAGQLPVAVAAALALRWLDLRLEPALAVLRIEAAPAGRCVPVAIAWRSWRFSPGLAPVRVVACSYLRGPPSF
jgi:hypothetical protein